MGEVWLALDLELGDRPVAIKIMHSRMLASPEDAARFQREMRLASRMQHQNILTVFTTGTANGVPFMVMEYLKGRDLGKMPPGWGAGQAARIGRDTCTALAYAHGLDVVHRDIKPGNLFLCDTGVVKVTDFGIAKAVSGTKLSATGMLIGTFGYMAPEQWLGGPAAFSNDIWAVGCVLYELITGRLPRVYSTPAEYVAAAARREQVLPLQSIARAPAWLADAVMAMLQPDPRSRPSASDCLQLLSGLPAHPVPVPFPRSAQQPSTNSAAVPVLRPGPPTVRPPAQPVARPPAPRNRRHGKIPNRRHGKIKVLTPVVIAAAVITAVAAFLATLPSGPSTRSAGRGDIVTADGVVIAGTTPSNDKLKYQRTYPDGPVYAPVTGYDTIYSTSGVEHAEDAMLSQGAAVRLTINSKAQLAAYEGLAKILAGTGRVGGVVALNPATGAILAMASYPSYNPNVLASHDGTTVNDYDEALLRQDPSPLVNNATQTTLPPGSTFKIVTSSAWFAQDITRNTASMVYSPQVLTLPQTVNKLHNDGDEVCGPAGANGQATILWAFSQSCDTTFGNLGIDLGGEALAAMAGRFGMNDPDLDIAGVTVAPSQYLIPDSPPLAAFSAIGQYSDTVTPLQEAMFAAAIADNGTLMKPYLIQQVTASDLAVVQAATPAVLTPSVVSPAIAGYLRQMMTAVVQDPQGTAFAYNAASEGGLVIAGKTGTAQNLLNGASPNPDAVFTAFAPAGNPKIAVGVIVQGGGYGAAAAAPIAVAVIQAYLAAVGQLRP